MAKQKRKTKNTVSRTKLMAVQHTGRLRPHRHTSYGMLVLMLLTAFAPLLSVTRTVSADSNSLTSSVVPAPAPTTAPVITSIPSGKVYTSGDPITASGTCPANTLVKVFKNQVLGGAVLCHGGTFSLQLQLFEGSNSLIARAYNPNDEPGPDSTPLIVRLQLPGTNSNGSDTLNALGPPVGQFYLTTEVFYRGAQAGDAMSWPVTIAGGQAPYAVSVGWGDGKTDLISRGTTGPFNISHSYDKGNSTGEYTVIIRATDQNGANAFLQLDAIVSGTNKAIPGIIKNVGGGSPWLRLAWELLALAIAVVLSFWLGEKREKRLMKGNKRAPGGGVWAGQT